MRPRRDRAERRTAQYEFAISEADQVGEVGLAAAELTDAQRPAGTLQTLPQIQFKPRRIEPLIRPLVDQLGRFELWRHRRSASFETRAAPAPQDDVCC